MMRIPTSIRSAIFAVLAFGSLALCACADTASQAAFSQYYSATAADQRAYVTADAALTPEQKARRFAAIDAAGTFLKTAKPTQAAPIGTGIIK